MGSVAGSGGYYVACAADTIFADATTLTGSIGVLAGKLVTTEMWHKIGINFKEYKRGQNAGLLSTDEVFSESERAQMRTFLDETYEAFKGHVQQIRGDRLKKPLEELAGGRVFTGKQALDLGLVDRLGTLNDAIVFVAGQVQIKDYEVRAVPEPKNFIEQLMEEVTDGKKDANRLRSLPINGSLLKLALPYLEQLDPKRVKAVLSALTRLEVLRSENVVLTMPEIVITP
jgi:protease-4